MIHKVVIAAAGQGTRMKHLSKNKSKHLINICQKPFLCYLLDNLLAAGYGEMILVVGYREDLMREFLKKYNYQATIVNQFEVLGPKEKEYGTLCPIKCVKDMVGGDNFLAVYGDNLYSVTDLKAFHSNDNFNYVGGFHSDHPEKYGVLLEEDGFLKEIIEKPKEYVGSLINTGLYKFTPDIFAKIPQVRLSARGEYELTDAITFLAKEKKVKIKKINDYWLDFGNPSDVLKMNKFIKSFERRGKK